MLLSASLGGVILQLHGSLRIRSMLLDFELYVPDLIWILSRIFTLTVSTERIVMSP